MTHGFRPYPRVWDAFADDPEALRRLNSNLTFEALTETSRRFATQGQEAARAYLMNQYPPPVSALVSKIAPRRFPYEPRGKPPQATPEAKSETGIDVAELFNSYAEWEAANLAKKARKETPP